MEGVQQRQQAENAEAPSQTSSQNNAPIELTPHELEVQKKLVRKLDLRFMIWAFFAYWANGLDRNNMRNLQIPSNMIITKVRPSLMLPAAVTTWGGVVCFMALVRTHSALYGLRILLGFAEAPFYPGMVFLLGNWYTRQELGTRTAFFVAGSQFSGAFSGLISGAIADTLDGAHGMRGWKWLFIIEGLIGVAIGVVGFFLIPDYPHNTRWIVGEERELAVKRLELQGKKVIATGLNLTTLRNVCTTPYIYLFIIIFTCMQLGMGILQNFAIILRESGYEASFSNYMTVPYWCLAAVVIVAQGWLSDHYGKRHWHIQAGALWTLVFYVLLVAVNHGNVPIPLLYVCTYMVVPVLGISPIMMTWNNEIHQCDPETRALAIAIVNAIGNLAPNFINVKSIVTQAPAFRTGKIVSTSTTALMMVVCLLVYYLEEKKIALPKAKDTIKAESVNEKKEVEEV
ncbi:major facilitator superfamily domain-containing protein [Zychaea mexicana]|uniref:major facilitator superfamily domain-containing protein n=1 Tax=Zychaea mexicana TaxID=64656 RepID=UPI0022FF0B96|nr:major facilitator superfamily domain-containing protein [Zychaea mexicana]KAI9491329.1 major facilitator superfamily domain-containing protein [Zychaea mexicana]